MLAIGSRSAEEGGAGAIHEIAIPASVLANMHPTTRGFRTESGCTVLVAREPQGWHLSIAHTDRYPTWDEIADVRYALLPDEICAAIIMPPKSEYVNIHNNCFHVHEVP